MGVRPTLKRNGQALTVVYPGRPRRFLYRTHDERDYQPKLHKQWPCLALFGVGIWLGGDWSSGRVERQREGALARLYKAQEAPRDSGLPYPPIGAQDFGSSHRVAADEDDTRGNRTPIQPDIGGEPGYQHLGSSSHIQESGEGKPGYMRLSLHNGRPKINHLAYPIPRVPGQTQSAP